MRTPTKIILASSIPLALAAWALFRPELLFVNQTVNESAPAAGAMTFSEGDFVSGAHETKGHASLFRSQGKTYLRLTGFHTSNGPDVRVVLLPSSSTAEGSSSALDLGSIKGNIGDQNYLLPEGADGSRYSAVSIWCKRFNVGFGKADLAVAPKESASLAPASTLGLAGFAPITVTWGAIEGSSQFKGKIGLTEDQGKRWVDLKLDRLPKGDYTAWLLKKETVGVGPVPNVEKVALGALKKGKTKVSVSKDLDLWLYRSVVLVNKATSKAEAFSLLRADQERTKPTQA